MTEEKKELYNPFHVQERQPRVQQYSEIVNAKSQTYRIAREYYEVHKQCRDFTHLHFFLSLQKASIDPWPKEDWLTNLSNAVLDYWITGECYMGILEGKIVHCDPALVMTGNDSNPGEGSYNFYMPEDWRKVHGGKPLYMMNKDNPYDLRGSPIFYKQMIMLSNLRREGRAQKLSPLSFGFGPSQANTETSLEISKKVHSFRMKLGMALNTFWPDLIIDFFPVTQADVISEAQKIGLIG